MGARKASVYAELWQMLCTVFILVRAAAAVGIAIRAADQLEKELFATPRALRGPAIFCLVQLGTLIAMWIWQVRVRLRTLGGPAVAEDRSTTRPAPPVGGEKPKKE